MFEVFYVERGIILIDTLNEKRKNETTNKDYVAELTTDNWR